MEKLQRIVLIGLMGAGKSCVGKRLAARMELPFFDVDAEIEAAASCSIQEIFARFGEASFRDGERRIIERLLNEVPSVLATGGGAFMDEKTRIMISEKGISIWLRADLDLLVRRTSGRDHRPLLNQGNPREILAGLMKNRYPIYAQADVIVDSFDDPTDVTVDNVYKALMNFLGDQAGKKPHLYPSLKG